MSALQLADRKHRVLHAPRHSVLFLSLLAASMSVAAQTAPLPQQRPPDAGQLLRDQPKPDLTPPVMATPKLVVPGVEATQAPSGPRFVLKQVGFQGNKTVATPVLQALISDALNHETDMAGLQQLALRVTEHYRAQGYLLARVLVPAQTVREGSVELRVFEGELDSWELRNNTPINTAYLQMLTRAIPAGSVLRSDQLDRAFLLMTELPGVVGVSSTLAPGTRSGTSTLTTELDAGKRVTGRVFADNYGNRYSGQYRLGMQLLVNNPFHRADLLSGVVLMSDQRTLSGRVGWDSLLAGNGMRGGLAVSTGSYRLGQEFAKLDASGRMSTVSLYGRLPLLRSPNHWMTLDVNVEHRDLLDRINATSTRTHKTANVLSAGVSGRHRDASGITMWNAQWTAGKLKLDGVTTQLLDQAGPRTAGSYNKFDGMLRREQAVSRHWSVLAQVRGQVATRNLDSSEKLSLGGAEGIRALAQGDGVGDQGWVGRLDVRYTLNPNLRVGAGYDAGSVLVNKRPYLPTSNSLQRSGIAVYAEANTAQGWDFTAILAWRQGKLNTVPGMDDKSPRVWVQAGYRF